METHAAPQGQIVSNSVTLRGRGRFDGCGSAIRSSSGAGDVSRYSRWRSMRCSCSVSVTGIRPLYPERGTLAREIRCARSPSLHPPAKHAASCVEIAFLISRADAW